MGTSRIKFTKENAAVQIRLYKERIQKVEDAHNDLVKRYNTLLSQARQLNQNSNTQALLLCSLIQEAGGKLEVKHATMAGFEKSRLVISADADAEKGVQTLTFENNPIPDEEWENMQKMQAAIAAQENQQNLQNTPVLAEAVKPAAAYTVPEPSKHQVVDDGA